MAIKVEYNGSVVATIPSGNKATIPIKDLKMKTDIVITVPSNSGGGGTVKDSALPIEVATEAEMTALLESGEVGGVYKYTGTTGTYENGALYVLEEEEAVLISFTIKQYDFGGTTLEKTYTCQAEEGMTWAEWIESEYKTVSALRIYNGKVSYWGDYSFSSNNGDTENILSTDVITADTTYYLRSTVNL